MLSIYQVDAFTKKKFKGNPAAVVPLFDWLDDNTLQLIAAENNLSETAFFIVREKSIELRWFTPNGEVDLCGHATLATAHILFTELGYQQDNISFNTKSGELFVSKKRDAYSMIFPKSVPTKIDPTEILIKEFGNKIVSVSVSYDYLVELTEEQDVINYSPNFDLLTDLDRRGLIVSAKGNNYDVISRCFYPKYNVNEDPVTGSAHCILVPYWSSKLDKKNLSCYQASKRGGELQCELDKDQVIIRGYATTYMKGSITID